MALLRVCHLFLPSNLFPVDLTDCGENSHNSWWNSCKTERHWESYYLEASRGAGVEAALLGWGWEGPVGPGKAPALQGIHQHPSALGLPLP